MKRDKNNYAMDGYSRNVLTFFRVSKTQSQKRTRKLYMKTMDRNRATVVAHSIRVLDSKVRTAAFDLGFDFDMFNA